MGTFSTSDIHTKRQLYTKQWLASYYLCLHGFGSNTPGHNILISSTALFDTSL